ncbi:MAG: DNA translocase FtsK 4TM domain-containing protein, partial [Gemmatimonadaceae bacterium]
MSAAALTALAALGLVLALVRGDLTLRYVAEHITLSLPPTFRAATLWTGGAGQRLVFGVFLSACAAFATRSNAKWPSNPRSTVALTIAVLLALALSALGDPPFERLAWQPSEGGGGGSGRGMAAQLQTALVVAPPLLLLGLALLIVAGALALDRAHRPRVASWLLAAWVWQTIAVSLGGFTLEHLAAPAALLPTLWIAPTLWLATSIILIILGVRSWRNAARRRGVALLTSSVLLGATLAAAGGVGRLAAATHAVSLGQGESIT